MRMRAAVGALLAVAAVSSGCGVFGAHLTGGHHVGGGRPSARPRMASPTPAARRPATVARPAARQLVTVTAASYGATYAVLEAYEASARTGGRWRRVLGPWTARLGTGGLAPPGQKREGDGRTPSGSYGFGFFFGVQPNPGVAFPYRQSQPSDVWDDDPSSARYNEWVDDRTQDPGAGPEPMFVSGYDYGAVIAYNTARTPGLGSAIFLHVNIGRATTGCVTLPADELLRILRWLRPGGSPRIRLTVASPG